MVFARQYLGWRSGEIWLVTGIFFFWLVAGWVWGNFARPDSLTSLSIFDKKGGWKDQFSSAWAFLVSKKEGEIPSRGESLHLIQAGKQLPEALTHLKKLLPLPIVKWLWLLPLLAILFSLLPLLRPGIAAGDAALTKEMQDTASEQGDQLKAENERVKNMESLDKVEREELKKLRADVDAVAEELANSEATSAMEVLEALESRARAAERLARKLGIDDNVWASDEMLKEMSQHPDTADLALAIKSKKADPVAAEADKIAAVLKQKKITRETENRIAASLEQTMEKASEEDREKPVGERVGNASRKMLDRQVATAAHEFENLAKHFRIVSDREDARKKLEELAAKLRDAGSEISGSKLQKMKQLAKGQVNGQKKNPLPKGLKTLQTNPLANKLQNLSAPQTPLPGQMGNLPKAGKNNGQQQVPIPGAAPKPQGGNKESKQSGLSAPIPGQNKEGGNQGMAKQGAQGMGKQKGQGGALTAPVPGQSGQGQGGAPGGDGAAVGSNGAQGGNEAGRGTAALVDNKTETLKAAKNSKIVAQINQNGESSTRAVEGKVRSEVAERSQKEIMVDFITVEEQALDSKTLPMSRRTHVLRYFSEIRKQFEKESKE